jgi:hypothetical protein
MRERASACGGVWRVGLGAGVGVGVRAGAGAGARGGPRAGGEAGLGAWERGVFCGTLESGQGFLAALPICIRRKRFGLVELIMNRGTSEFSGLQG